jgi:hypothetical protein
MTSVPARTFLVAVTLAWTLPARADEQCQLDAEQQAIVDRIFPRHPALTVDLFAGPAYTTAGYGRVGARASTQVLHPLVVEVTGRFDFIGDRALVLDYDAILLFGTSWRADWEPAGSHSSSFSSGFMTYSHTLRWPAGCHMRRHQAGLFVGGRTIAYSGADPQTPPLGHTVRLGFWSRLAEPVGDGGAQYGVAPALLWSPRWSGDAHARLGLDLNASMTFGLVKVNTNVGGVLDRYGYLVLELGVSFEL